MLRGGNQFNAHLHGAKKEHPHKVDALCKTQYISLALAQLGCAACSLQTVLLAFLHSGVAGQETGSLQSRAVALVNEEESIDYAPPRRA